jgi:predicted AAA+ superfamily ATPase
VNDVITEFRGRGDEVRVYPLSIAELHEAFPDKSWDDLWSEYSYFGGLPQTILMNDTAQKSQYLKQLFQTTYFKDIIDRYHIQQVESFGQLADFVASAIGSLTNPHKLSNTFSSNGLKISDDTIKQYLNYLQDAFLISEAKRYDIRGKQYIGSPYKYYFTDIGLRNALLNFRQYEETHLMENIIYIELLRRKYAVDVGMVEVIEQVNGKREHKRLEIDFVANRGSERYYIQSAFAMPSEEKIQQEGRPLLKVKDSFKKIIVVKEPIIHRYNENGVLIISLKQFLFDENSLML